MSKNYQNQLDILLVDCYNGTVLNENRGGDCPEAVWVRHFVDV